MPKEQKASTPYLFQVCRQHFSEPVARVASEGLFWSQCGQHKLRGRAGIFKEDAELAPTIGKHASSIRRALSRICAKVGENCPEALFEIDHGPKPGQRSGRVRWLFRTPRGDKMIREALLLAEVSGRKRRNARNNRRKTPLLVVTDSAHRSALNERTPYSQKDSSESHAEALSSKWEQREKLRSESLEEKSGEEEKENNRKELTRFVTRWNAICAECKEPTLAWLHSDVERLAPRLIEVIRQLRIPEMADEELSKRFRLLCGEGSVAVFTRLGPRVRDYNPNGLLIETFTKFGPRVWRAVEAELSERAYRPPSGQALSVKRQKPLLLEYEAREVERLIETWNKACDERGRPTARWSREAVDQCAVRLLPVINATRMHQIPDQEVACRLGNVVDCLASNGPVDDLATLTLNHFVHNRIPSGWNLAETKNARRRSERRDS